VRADGVSRRREAEDWLPDRLPAQLRHAEEHQVCLVHLIHDAQYTIDHGDMVFIVLATCLGWHWYTNFTILNTY
jgi:hypothetical protein